MSGTLLFVVGDRFEGFLTNAGTIGISALRERLEREGRLHVALTPGQGLGDEEVAELQRLAARGRIDLRMPAGAASERATPAQTHKRLPENILLSAPRRVDATTFEAELLIDDASEVLSDHMTGQHIQGMALIEAARQMWTAVTEIHLLGEQPRTFVLDLVSAQFHRFVFPLPARVRHEVLEDLLTAFDRRFAVRVTFFQVDLVAAVVDARFRVVEPRLMSKQEALAARRTLASCGAAARFGDEPLAAE